MAKVPAEINVFDYHQAAGTDRPQHLTEHPQRIGQMGEEKPRIDAIVLGFFDPIMHV
jgi:hypothetical protein